MHYTVTGGAGFIGSHLVERLLHAGHTVTVIDDLSAGEAHRVPEEVGFIEERIQDEDAIREAVSGADAVFHLAANADVRTQNDDRGIDIEENVVGTRHVLEAMLDEGVDRIVFTSTSTVYGEADEFPTPETYGHGEPISLYGSSKLSAESLVSAYAHSFGITGTSLRLANIIGPRSDHGVTYDFVQKLQHDDSELEVLGNGRQKKSYLFVDDVIEAIMVTFQEQEGEYGVFNVSNTDTASVTRIAEIVIDAMDCDADISYTGGDRGWTGDVPEMLLATERLEALGWEPTMSSEEAVRRTAEGLING